MSQTHPLMGKSALLGGRNASLQLETRHVWRKLRERITKLVQVRSSQNPARKLYCDERRNMFYFLFLKGVRCVFRVSGHLAAPALLWRAECSRPGCYPSGRE